MNDDSIAKHMYCHVLSVLLTGQKKKKKKKKKKKEYYLQTVQNDYKYLIFKIWLRNPGYM